MGRDGDVWGWVGMGVLKEILIKDKDMMEIEELKKIIRDVPDFPSKGILFRDLTTMISNHADSSAAR